MLFISNILGMAQMIIGGIIFVIASLSFLLILKWSKQNRLWARQEAVNDALTHKKLCERMIRKIDRAIVTGQLSTPNDVADFIRNWDPDGEK